MDGNFKAKHMQPKNPANEVWLMNGIGFMVMMPAYKDYLARTLNQVEVSGCTCDTVKPANEIHRNQTVATIEQ